MSLIKRLATKVLLPAGICAALAGCASIGSGYAARPGRVMYCDVRSIDYLDDVIAKNQGKPQIGDLVERYDAIIHTVRHDTDYDPKEDMLDLMADIRKSDIKAKQDFIDRLKGFKYIKVEKAAIGTRTYEVNPLAGTEKRVR